MIQALFRANVKDIRTVWVLMAGVFLLYFVIILAMYDPAKIEALDRMLEMFPEALLKAFGMEHTGPDLLSFTTTYMYGIQLLLYPMAISMVSNHKLIAAHVDRGSMAYLLSTPNSRKRIVLTQMLFSLCSMGAFFALVTASSLWIARVMHPGQMATGGFILLNVYALSLYFAIGGIGFFASCVANDSKTSLGMGIGVPIAFLALQMMGDAGEKSAWVGKLSLYNLYRPETISRGDPFAYYSMAAFLAIAAGLYALGAVIFEKRDFHV